MRGALRHLPAAELLPLARERCSALAATSRLGVHGESMAPTFCDGDVVRLSPPRSLVPGTVVFAEIRGALLIHRLVRLEGNLALVAADGCRRKDGSWFAISWAR